ncbi:hypothetical protein AB0K14_34020 [Actinosynnema sp. NPDC050801]|uniref:hypothetical protein n=1 Tax=unclassified Actinosynnema TaxID=2637065 RepID=UPI0033E07C55
MSSNDADVAGLRGRVNAFTAPARHRQKKWINNTKGQVATLILTPVLILGMVVIVGFASGVATQPGCTFRQLIGQLVFSQDGGKLLCRSVPLWGDIPSLTLCLTSSFALGLFWVFVTRLRSLQEKVVSVGLFHKEDLEHGAVGDALASLRKNINYSKKQRLPIFVVSLGLGFLLYLWTLNNGEIFRDLAGIYSSANGDPVREEDLRRSWWANYENHFALAALWIVIGALGTYCTILQGYLYVVVGLFIFKVRRILPARYVPKRLNRHYGWGAGKSIVTATYFGAINFAVSLTAIIYMLSSAERGSTTNVIIAIIVLLGVGATSLFLFSLIFQIKKKFRASVAEELAVVNARLADVVPGVDEPRARPRRGGYDAYQLVLANELANTPRYPSDQKTLNLLSLLPGLAALVKLVQEAAKII